MVFILSKVGGNAFFVFWELISVMGLNLNAQEGVDSAKNSAKNEVHPAWTEGNQTQHPAGQQDVKDGGGNRIQCIRMKLLQLRCLEVSSSVSFSGYGYPPPLERWRGGRKNRCPFYVLAAQLRTTYLILLRP